MLKPRDDRNSLVNFGYIHQFFIGIAWYCPISRVKKLIFRMLGAKIGDGVYIGPGAVIMSSDFTQVTIGDGVFIAPGVMIKVSTLSLGDHTHIGYQCLLVGESLSIGKRCNISNRSFIESAFAPVVIEDDVTISASVVISTHDGAFKQARGLGIKVGPILLKEHAFIGTNATILQGISVGKRAIVGVGAVVTRDVKEDTIVAGVPAKEIQHANG